MRKNTLAIDLGYSNLKMSKTNALTIDELKAYVREENDETRKEMGIEFALSIMPAGACLASEMPKGILSKATGRITTYVDGQEWKVGMEFSQAPVKRDLSTHYKHTNEWRAMLNAALIFSKWEVIDTLVLGLPCREYYETDGALELKKIAMGKHEVQPGVFVTVKNVIVDAQPVGSLLGYILTDADEKEEELLTSGVTTLILDPGFYSWDYVVVQDFGVLKGTSGSTVSSVRAVCDHVEAQFKEKYPKSQPAKGVIEAGIRSGKHELIINGSKQSFEEELELATKAVAADALHDIRTALSNSNIYPQITLLTGGGSNLFEAHIERDLDTDILMTSDEAVVLNCFGYLPLGISRANEAPEPFNPDELEPEDSRKQSLAKKSRAEQAKDVME